MKLTATHLRANEYVVRPEGRLGTCGWLPNGRAWTAVFVRARSAKDALAKVSLDQVISNPKVK